MPPLTFHHVFQSLSSCLRKVKRFQRWWWWGGSLDSCGSGVVSGGRTRRFFSPNPHWDGASSEHSHLQVEPGKTSNSNLSWGGGYWLLALISGRMHNKQISVDPRRSLTSFVPSLKFPLNWELLEFEDLNVTFQQRRWGGGRLGQGALILKSVLQVKGSIES